MSDVFLSYVRPDEPHAERVIRLAASDPNLDNLRSDPRFQRMLKEAQERARKKGQSGWCNFSATSLMKRASSPSASHSASPAMAASTSDKGSISFFE
jgi:hypothetical protein